MHFLAQRIELALQTEKQCFIRPDELKQVWPGFSDKQREDTVREFAREHGWQIFTYSRILGAMFVRDSALSRTRTG